MLDVPVPATPVGPAASAAVVVLDARCYVSGRPITIAGAGFVPDAPLTVLGGATPRTTRSDALGRLAAMRITAPRVRGFGPSARTIRVRDVQDASLAAALPTWVVREAFDTNAPLAGAPRERTTWRFAGFRPGLPVYGHFRLHGRTLRSHRFGLARGPCGTLAVRASRIPLADVPPGTWTLKLDQRPRYLAGTVGRTIRFAVGHR